MERLRVAIIGAWGHIDAVLAEVDHLPWVEVVGWAKALPEEDGEVIAKFESGRRAKEWASWRELLKSGGAQVAVVSTRLDLIAPLAIEAAEAGCDLICEKPLALTHARLAELRAAVTDNRRLCIGMLNNRSQPVLQAARAVVQSGRLGNVVLANAGKSYKWGRRPEWFGKREFYGGTIGWIGIHGLDFIQTATGENFTSVAAMQGNLARRERPDCEDHCGLLLGLSGEGHATLSVDFLRPAMAATHGNDWVRVMGSRGELEANLTQRRCLVTTDESGPEEIAIGRGGGYYEEFLQQVREDIRTPPHDMEKAFYLTHVSLCARDAAERRQTVVIAPPPAPPTPSAAG